MELKLKSSFKYLITSYFFLQSPLSSAHTFNEWRLMVDTTKEAQPHWITPVATVTPRLEQEIRLDYTKQYMANGATYTNYGAGKGLEIIPTENTEIVINFPNYQTRDGGPSSTIKDHVSSAWQDESLLVKYRFLSANEENGNYILTGFLGASLPTGSDNSTFSNHKEVYTATLAAGKGWGDRHTGIDIQSTFGVSSIAGEQIKTGTNIPSVAWNTTLQAHVYEYLWPEIEMNVSHFEDGPAHGKNQVIMTYGLMLGRFKLSEHSNFIIGGGYQNSVSDYTLYGHGWNISSRITF